MLRQVIKTVIQFHSIFSLTLASFHWRYTLCNSGYSYKFQNAKDPRFYLILKMLTQESILKHGIRTTIFSWMVTVHIF